MTHPIGIQNTGKFRKMPLETLHGEKIGNKTVKL
jgi:hypothetical protein